MAKDEALRAEAMRERDMTAGLEGKRAVRWYFTDFKSKVLNNVPTIKNK